MPSRAPGGASVSNAVVAAGVSGELSEKESREIQESLEELGFL
jgi:hypothetical protein